MNTKRLCNIDLVFITLNLQAPGDFHSHQDARQLCESWQLSTSFATISFGRRTEACCESNFEIDSVTKYRFEFARPRIPFDNPRPFYFGSRTVPAINHHLGRFNSILSAITFTFRTFDHGNPDCRIDRAHIRIRRNNWPKMYARVICHWKFRRESTRLADFSNDQNLTWSPFRLKPRVKRNVHGPPRIVLHLILEFL